MKILRQDEKNPGFKDLDVGDIIESTRTKFKGMLYCINSMAGDTDEMRAKRTEVIKP